tara:strand:+ start:1804 stop:2679 length:876 start_codon:yes stop_codon:yes gene_type:complete
MRPSIIIHAGLPRTATTTLQKTLFPRHCYHPLYTKDKMSSMLRKNEYDILHKLNEGQELTNAEIARTIFTASARTNNNNDEWFSTLLKALEKLLITSEWSELPPILSSEFLTLTVASYNIRGSEAGRQFGVIPLVKAVNKLTNERPKIILCLRDPIEHFCSMFLRIVRQGISKKEDFNKYVKYQFRLEKSWEYSSNVAHLYHRSLITYLEDLNSIVKPIRYKDLLESSDALRLLNLEGEKIALSKLQKENHHLSQSDFNLSQDQITHMQVSIRNLFKALDIYNKIYEEAFM